MKTMNENKNERSPHQLWAEFRFGVVGGLLSAPSNSRELAERIRELSEKQWAHPIKGEPVQFGVSTIERWYYEAKNKTMDPVGSLRRKLRSDSGTTRHMSQEIKNWLLNNHERYSSWSYQLHTDNLKAWLDKYPEQGMMPSYASVLRFMKLKGCLKSPRPRSPFSPGVETAKARLQSYEVRSFESEYVGGLWHLDFHHGSRQIVIPNGERVTPVCLCILDDHSRLACHVQWYLGETTEILVHGFTQALQKRGLPRALMSDNGSAMISHEFEQGLSRLGIQHELTLAFSPYQNGKQESFWGNIEGRLMSMLEHDKELDLSKLNLATQAWAEVEYNKKLHSETNQTPMDRFLHGKEVLRPTPDLTTLKLSFRADVKRRQRRSDGTFSLEGKRFEIPTAWKSLKVLTVRYARWDLTQVHLVDERTQNLLCPVYPIDRIKNADGLRRAIQNPVENETALLESQEDPPLLKKLLEEYSSTGLPPAYIPTHNEEL